ncbi:ataxin-3 [Dendroctonus ponderosae]
MEAIFHEKQDGSLCAQHCLNSLLQGPYFTAVELGTLANRLDEEEREQMAEGGMDTEDYRQFLQQPSTNMDDSGYFSVQVITSALQVWGLELVPYCSTDERAKAALENPAQMQAFICNYKDHWCTIRKIGNQWFNLNSLLAKPQLISNTYLALFLAQLRNEGYSIFIVSGELPECAADDILRNNPVKSCSSPRSHVFQTQSSSSETDPDVQAALRLSLQDSGQYDSPDVEEIALQEALRMSMQASSSSPEEDDDEDSLLKKAITMSLQC